MVRGATPAGADAEKAATSEVGSTTRIFFESLCGGRAKKTKKPTISSTSPSERTMSMVDSRPRSRFAMDPLSAGDGAGHLRHRVEAAKRFVERVVEVRGDANADAWAVVDDEAGLNQRVVHPVRVSG